MTTNTQQWLETDFNWQHRPAVNGLMNSLELEQRLQALQHALELHPDDGFLHGQFGRASLQDGKIDAAINHLNKAVERESSDFSLIYALGLAYRQKGDNERALPLLQQAVEIGCNVDHIMVLVRTACDINEFDAALSACTTGLQKHPSEERLQCAYPQTLAISGDPEAALTWLDENDTGSSKALAQLKYSIYTELNRTENAKLAQQEYQRRLLRTQSSYREEAMAVLDSLPSNTAKIALAQLWKDSIDALIDSEESDTPINLAMSILVRDEVDIIEHNIRYHAAMGVKHFVVTDNSSKDGTRELLEELSDEYSLTIIDEPSHTIDQDLWVTRMAKAIQEKGGYDWIIHNDADEFWHPDNGRSLPVAINDTLRLSGKLKNQVGVLSCPRFNMIGSIEDSRSPDFRFYRNTHRVKQDVPLTEGEQQWNDSDTNTVARLILDKVMTRTDGLSTIEYGNHGAEHDLFTEECSSVTIYHFPVRTYQQFEKKVKNYGESLKANTRFEESSSVHLRYWYKRYLQGKLIQEYESIAFSEERLAKLEQQGYLEPSTVISSFFNP